MVNMHGGVVPHNQRRFVVQFDAFGRGSRENV